MSESLESLEKLIEENNDNLNKLEEWIALQKHIPKSIPRNVLIRFLKFCDFDLEETKKLVDSNVKFRIKHKYLFTDRDIDSEEFKNLITTIQYARFPKLTKDGYVIESIRLANQNMSNFKFKRGLKLILMAHDMDNLVGPNINGIVQIYDASGFNAQHFTKVVSKIQAAIHYAQYGTPSNYTQAKQVHFLHCTSFVKKIIAMVKPFLSKEMMESIHCHKSDFATLHKFIEQEYLPIEFGGSLGTFEEHANSTVRNLQNNRDYLINQENFFLSNK